MCREAKPDASLEKHELYAACLKWVTNEDEEDEEGAYDEDREGW